MPTYRSVGVSVNLSVSDLASSTTTTLERWNNSVTKARLAEADSAIANGSVLIEKPIRSNSGTSMGFLGEARDMPFFMACATGERFENNLSGPPAQQVSTDYMVTRNRKSRNPSTIPPPAINVIGNPVECRQGLSASNFPASPASDASLDISRDSRVPKYLGGTAQALTVAISISNNSFLRNILKDCEDACDIKAEVMYNGEYAASRYIPSKAKTYTHGNHRIYISGKRVGKMAELAWTVTFPNDREEITLRDSPKSEVLVKRWNAINDRLRREADQRGIEENGTRPPVGEYLNDLSNMSMPECLNGSANSSHYQMSIIDVVLTLGKGRKLGTSSHYLSQPTRLEDPDHRLCALNPLNSNLSQQTHTSGSASRLHFSPIASTAPEREDVVMCDADTGEVLSYQGIPAGSNELKCRYGTRQLSANSKTAEEMPTSRPTRSHNARTQRFSTPTHSSESEPSVMEVAIKEGVSPSGSLMRKIKECTSGSPASSALLTGPDSSPSKGAAETDLRRSDKSSRQENNPRFKNLSFDAIASYAEPGAWCDPKQGGRGGPLRQIRLERNGEFKEDSILVGVRFVLL